MAYIYSIYNKSSKKRYIGQTIQPIHKRIYQHFHQSKKGVDTPLYHALRKYHKLIIITLSQRDIIVIMEVKDLLDLNIVKKPEKECPIPKKENLQIERVKQTLLKAI